MIRDVQLRLSPECAANRNKIIELVSLELGVPHSSICDIRVVRRSIDARQRRIWVNLGIKVYIDELPADEAYSKTIYPCVSDAPKAVVVGAGPGGLFAALHLIERGICPIVLERGRDVRSRKKDIAAISRNQKVNAESNYCFGEGGAGAYSDGKLYTRSHKRGSVSKILNVFCQHGAPLSILSDAHPHIGTDKLPLVIENIRKTILQCGGEVHFQTRMEQLLMQGNRVEGVLAKKKGNDDVAHSDMIEFHAPVILATGHSARDVYRYLAGTHIAVEAKNIAVGVRLEHPAHLIDQIQYHRREGRGKWLPAAEYAFVEQVNGRGVYSFCMCPGGFIIPAATGDSQLVVNGMSPSNRGTVWSNSGMVVELHTEDISDNDNPLVMLEYQEQLERLCWEQGGCSQHAPAQRMADFVASKSSSSLPVCSYTPGIVSSDMHRWMPSFIATRLQKAFEAFGRKSRGFLTNDAVILGMETRTSSPVRILRDKTTLESIGLQGLFPCGEGAGYAGGIVSAAIDGERCADALAEYIYTSDNLKH